MLRQNSRNGKEKEMGKKGREFWGFKQFPQTFPQDSFPHFRNYLPKTVSITAKKHPSERAIPQPGNAARGSGKEKFINPDLTGAGGNSKIYWI
jgi:hypothetical protein